MIPRKEPRKKCRKEIIVLQKMMREQLDIPYLTPPRRINSRWIIIPNITAKAIKVLGDALASLDQENIS